LLFFSSPFDEDAVDFLAKLGLPAFKIASSELTNLPLIHKCASYGRPILMSTGMGTLAEAGAAIEACHIEENYQVAVLHCISEYPTPIDHSQINAVLELSRLFGAISGFSDHSLSPTLPAVAVAYGARIIEKHFTLSRDLDGPDHAVALEPDEFAMMARACREAVEALSAPGKKITPELKKVRSASLRGLYAAEDITAGTRVSKKQVVALRPSATLSIKDMHCVSGRTARVDLKRGDALKPEHFE
jgi:pseudaminic acid synthase